MRFCCWGLLLLLGWLTPVQAQGPERAAQPKAVKAESFQIPYRFTNYQHIMVRCKINGKGPFNFIIDTGAPIMIVSTDAAKKAGLVPDDGLIAPMDLLEIEGGLKLRKFNCRVETPFQIEGMNGMGLAGRELHGMMGYTLLAKFRIEFDFTRDRMAWTPLDFNPPEPRGIRGKAGQGDLDILGKVLKIMGFFAKIKTETTMRGFVGVELKIDKDGVAVAGVLDKSPAAAAGLKAGDAIVKINNRPVASFNDVRLAAADMAPGKSLQFVVRRGEKKLTLNVTAGDGL